MPRLRMMPAEHWRSVRRNAASAAAMSPEDLEILRMRRRERRKERMREYARSRREFRAGDPKLAEQDRVRYNAARRKYVAKRKAADPAFLEACREANRRSAARRRAAAPVEVDET